MLHCMLTALLKHASLSQQRGQKHRTVERHVGVLQMLAHQVLQSGWGEGMDRAAPGMSTMRRVSAAGPQTVTEVAVSSKCCGAIVELSARSG
ncbi:hypothetical protein K505DRAFT_89286 [Melanomma pulvis-pyrius CBS 109.77]|uniref:Uncharacterized protein n=1 Tax=Melanomma pulvis-pyrius CBS 109.77 TaxID=1314802 RepID=A0A6A6X0U3_9PLEO|nr:hypothetical protein K505DRAFT_89286 [Melanomma pulvis-pyrius CBS 109.77]